MANPKAQAQPKQDAKKTSSPWAGLFIGIIVGIFIAFLAYLVINRPEEVGQQPSSSTNTQEKKPTTAKPSPSSETTQADNKPRFTFYNDLANNTVEIPEEELQSLTSERKKQSEHATAAHSTQTGDTKSTSSTQIQNKAYILQAGSFKSHREAEQLKARLAFMGVEANIQAVSVSAEERWHRVRIGPFSSISQADEIKRKLKQKRIPAIVLKLGK